MGIKAMHRDTYRILIVVIACIGLCITSAGASPNNTGEPSSSGVDGDGAQFTINATAGEFGTIEPSGIVTAAEGENITFLLTPDPADLNCWGAGTRYVVWNLTVDGEPVDIGPDPSIQPIEYNFTNVQSNHTIHANFAQMFITARPIAKFSADPVSGPVPLVVNFSQIWVSTHTRLLWSFGDNTTSTAENPTHTYTEAGLYTVSLTIWCDEEESYTEEKPDYIPVGTAPVANFTMNTSGGRPPLTVQFTDTSSGTPPLTYLWNFGDNTTSTEQDPVHTYAEGFYTVNLTVSDSMGTSTRTGDRQIIVMRPIGGDRGYFLVHCNVEGAKVFFDQTYKGMIENGSLLVQVYITAAPYHTYTVDKDGYQPFSASIPHYPPRDGTVDLYATLIPANGTVTGWVASGSDYGAFMLPGARIRVSTSIPSLGGMVSSREATTDARGVYTLSGLPTGMTLYATVLTPVNIFPDYISYEHPSPEYYPNWYYERPLFYQVNAGNLITCPDASSFPVIPALAPRGKTQVSFIVRQNPFGPPNSIIID
jgi:PKD repeat protein